MAFDAHSNLAYSTVATAPSPATSGTSLVVAAGQGSRFPSPPFNLLVWPIGLLATPATAEIVRVTGRAGDTLTISRAQEGTTARTIVVGDQVAATVTAKSLTDIESLANLSKVRLAQVSGNNTSTALVFDLSTIPDLSRFTSLEVVGTLRSALNGTSTSASLYLNQDAGSFYTYHRMHGQVAAVTAGEVLLDTGAVLGSVPGNSGTVPAGLYASLRVLFPNVNDAGPNKTFISELLGLFALTTGGIINTTARGVYSGGTGPLTYIDIRSASGFWLAGSTLTLYGLP